MPYLGRSSQKAIRQRFIFTQSSAGATSISGADDSNATLRFDDGEYVDVILNGITLAKTEYNTLTANTISGLAALSSGDVLQVTVYDMFNVADSVRASTGGTFNGGVTINGDLTVTGSGAGAAGIVSASTSGTAISIDSSNRVDAKVPMFHATRSANLTTASPYVCLFDTVVFDTDSWYATGTGRYTPQLAGYYYFVGQWSLATINTSHYLSVSLRKNGTQTFNRVQYGGSSTYPRPQVSGIFHCNGSSDYIDTHVSFSGGANSIWTDIQGNNFLGHYLGTGS